MAQADDKVRIFLIAMLVVIITLLHYGTRLSDHHQHILYRQLYFLPIILAGFWFGLKGALPTSLAVTVLYLPFIVIHWENFCPDDFNQLMGLTLYNAVAVILGRMRDRERAEQKRLRDAENLVAMGKAVSSLAHDMKTPLIAIGGFSRVVQRAFDQGDPNHQKLEIVIRETRRLEEMMKDMLDFTRPINLHRCREDINEIVMENLSIVEDIAKGKKVHLVHRLDSGLPGVFLDSMRMERVLINLIMNAIQASPEGESVEVNTYRQADSVVIDVVDCGCGIPPGQRTEIFAPFFTTKREGTGLGLCVVKKIVEAHKGAMEIIDNPDKGVTFRVSLPLDEE